MDSHHSVLCMDVPNAWSFTCDAFGTKSDYSGSERERWEIRTHDNHFQQVSNFTDARTASQQQQIENKYGVRYSGYQMLILLNTTLLIQCFIRYSQIPHDNVEG